MRVLRTIKDVIKNDWRQESPRMLFNILIAFLATFLIAHAYSLVVPFYVFIYGYHIHHFYYGMLLLAIAAIAGIMTNRQAVRHMLSYVIGVGIGLIVDELGLLLNCTGEKVGVCSYLFPDMTDIVVAVSLILVIFILFGARPIRWLLPRSWRNAGFERDYRNFSKQLRRLLP